MSKLSLSELRERLLECFAAVFAELPRQALAEARAETTEAWDSVTTLTLLSVIEEQFGITFDLNRAGRLDSFAAIEAHLRELLCQ
jgi:acyl carrier protein